MADQNESMRSLEEDGDKKHMKWEEKLTRVGPVSKPMATRKLAKKIYKITKKAHLSKTLRKGIRTIQKCVRKGERGLMFLAGDTTPVDVLCHMPIVCEESDIPYCFVPSKDDLGSCCGSNHPTTVVLVKPHESYQELYEAVRNEVKALPMPI